jgi:hypothetical protein
MKIKLVELIVEFSSSQEHINFGDFSYFWGKMGAGKSTIVRLVDYCMGGDIVMTPALQSEFLAATLNLTINESDLTLTRANGSNSIQASWTLGDDASSVTIPARAAAGVVLPETAVEVVSDLFFHLAGRFPPKIRRSRSNDESELERLSIRDLFWYCVNVKTTTSGRRAAS